MIAAVVALILTVLSGVPFRLGTVESVAAMAVPVLNPPAPRSPEPQRRKLPLCPVNPPLRSRLRTNSPAAATSSEIAARVSPPRGRLVISSQPVRAEIIINGRSHGLTPRTIGVPPGEYILVLRRGASEVRQTVVVAGGAMVSIVAPFQAGAVATGWLSMASAIDVDIFEGGVLVGSSRTPRIMLEAGSHTLEFVNEQTGSGTRGRCVFIPGTAEQIDVDLPVGTIHVNAVPWAEVWIDGTLVGQTPLGNHPVAIGPHRIVFRHPVLGEKEFDNGREGRCSDAADGQAHAGGAMNSGMFGRRMASRDGGAS